jgi:hypothetical protein
MIASPVADMKGGREQVWSRSKLQLAYLPAAGLFACS